MLIWLVYTFVMLVGVGDFCWSWWFIMLFFLGMFLEFGYVSFDLVDWFEFV